MSLPSGARLGPYEIVSPLGAGGMGEVYRARDTRLDRAVAVKVLSERLAASGELRQRFEREARAVSQLQHPHICTLYDVGRQDETEYLVMELLEGETLEKRLERGALPLADVLRIGREMAGALDFAHRRGVAHRDLKPGNIFLAKGGAKLLDFGLARVLAAESRGAASGTLIAGLPTEERPLTAQGTILGTFQYMSPEQLEGGEADARSDLFALGAVLYEMATGRKAFSGKSQASLISAIMSAEPPAISSLQPMTPPALDRLVATCLAKDPDERWQSAHDVAAQLAWIAEGGSQAGAPAPVVARRKSRERLAWGLAALAAVGAAALGWTAYRNRTPPPRPLRLAFQAPLGAPIRYSLNLTPSPDGRLLAWLAYSREGRRSIWLRPLDSPKARELPGTEDATDLFWSPDGRALGFFAEGKLKRLAIDGGPALALAEAPAPHGGTWSPAGTIVFAPDLWTPLFAVPAAGGKATAITELGPREEAHRWPAFLPDGKHFVFLGDAASTEDHTIRLGELGSPGSRALFQAVSNVQFAPPDFLLFVRARTLLAQRLDLESLEPRGEPVPLGENLIESGNNHRFDFAASQTGVLSYNSADPVSRLVWIDRTGRRLGMVGEPGSYGDLDLSPDDQRAAFTKRDADGRAGDVWVMDLRRGSASRLTTSPEADYAAVWSPGGDQIAFGSMRQGLGDVLVSPAGGGNDRALVQSPAQETPGDWSPDGRWLLYEEVTPAAHEDLRLLPLQGGESVPFRATPFAEHSGQFSPDGRWVAYCADDSGRNEVYLQKVTEPAQRLQVSNGGGRRPRWRGDGRELYYVASSHLYAVDVDLGEPPQLGEARILFESRVFEDYAVTRDGQRFLFTTSEEENPPLFSTIVLDWTSELGRPAER